MSQNREPRASPMALERGQEGAYHAYNELTFLHFLAMEEKRAERSGRTVLLLLVQLNEPASSSFISPAVADKLFAALTGCLREIDFVGWYRTDSVIGAVLLQPTDAPPPDTVTVIGARVGGMLRDRLPRAVARRIQARVVHVRPVVEP